MGKPRKLNGNKKTKAAQQREESPIKKELPAPLTKQKIQQWFKKAADQLEIDIQEVSKFMSFNGLALNMLQKEDWIRRSPDYGDILFNMWQKYQGQWDKKHAGI